jgi:excinuclease ABC subunit B
MYLGDLSRKTNLVNFGFRLLSAFDNRPLKWEEFYSRIPRAIYASATPAPFEINDTRHSRPDRETTVIEQIIRPTGLIDPPVTVKPSTGQIPDLIAEIQKRVDQKERTLVLTLTKKMAEELSGYLSKTFKTAYLHTDIETLDRSDILDKLRGGDFDVLVGINLLREGLDLPEVSLVAILDAGMQGFLRSRSSLIQIMGRASRHLNGQVILYADTVSDAMRGAISEVNRRRVIQLKYNADHGITPTSIIKSIRPRLIENPVKDIVISPLLDLDISSLTPTMRQTHIKKLRKEMRTAAFVLDFELAIKIRDKIREVEKL